MRAHGGILNRLLPPRIAAAELRDDGSGEIFLHAQEAQCVKHAVPGRVREFAAGRLCARLALAELGITNFPLIMGVDRAPQWPSGIVGSIAHAGGYIGAAVSEQKMFAGIGIDVEVLGRVTPQIWDLVYTREEIERLHAAVSGELDRMAAVMFSAKEAFYKCQYGLTQEWLEFKDVMVSIEEDRFTATVLRGSKRLTEGAFSGKFCFYREWVVTAIALRE